MFFYDQNIGYQFEFGSVLKPHFTTIVLREYDLFLVMFEQYCQATNRHCIFKYYINKTTKISKLNEKSISVLPLNN